MALNHTSRELEEKLASGWTGSRILSLTDNVFAFAMTLLILNFVIPADFASESLPQLFANLWPQFLTYFMSFAVLGTFWVGHHNLISLVKHVDRKSLWINIVFSSFIVLIPFSTGILRIYYTDQIAIMAYGVNLIICGLAAYWFWAHAVKCRLVRDDISPEMISIMRYRIVVPVAVAVLVTLFGFVEPIVSLFLFAALFFLVTIPTNSDSVVQAIARFSAKRKA